MAQAIMNKPRLSDKTPARETRYDAILDMSEQVFANSGYKGATMREIAERAGVAQGLIQALLRFVE